MKEKELLEDSRSKAHALAAIFTMVMNGDVEITKLNVKYMHDIAQTINKNLVKIITQT